MQLALNRITLDHRAQPRASLDAALVVEYTEAMKAGAQFPDLKVFFDGKRHYLADGFHRHPAALAAGIREYGCAVSDGTLRDAILFSCKANATHGPRRSDEDKRRAVRALLEDDEWSKWSDRQIAKQCGVSHPFVARIREGLKPAYLETFPDRNRVAVRGGGEPYQLKTGKIGQRAAVSEKPDGKVSSAAPSDGSTLDSPAYHDAMTVLARGIADIPGTPQEIVGGCKSQDEREELQEACAAAALKLEHVLKEMKPGAKRAA